MVNKVEQAAQEFLDHYSIEDGMVKDGITLSGLLAAFHCEMLNVPKVPEEPMEVTGKPVYNMVQKCNIYPCPWCGKYELTKGMSKHEDCGIELNWTNTP